MKTEDDYQCESDAECLKKHAEITADPDRHAKAHAHLQKQVVQGQDALDNSHRTLRKKVKDGMGKAFPKAY